MSALILRLILKDCVSGQFFKSRETGNKLKRQFNESHGRFYEQNVLICTCNIITVTMCKHRASSSEGGPLQEA